MALTIPNTITNAIPADGNNLGGNFSAIKAWADTVDAAVADQTPVGSVTMFAGATAPSGFLLCAGQAVSRSTYAALFAVVGTSYGSGDGTSTFNVPNLKTRTPVGLDASVTAFNALGKVGGSKDAVTVAHTHAFSATTASDSHTHTTDINHDHPNTTTSATTALSGGVAHDFKAIATTGGWPATGAAGILYGATDSRLPPGSTLWNAGLLNSSHTHTLDVPALGATNKTSSSDSHSHTVSGTSASTGSAGTDLNLQPYLILNFIVKH